MSVGPPLSLARDASQGDRRGRAAAMNSYRDSFELQRRDWIAGLEKGLSIIQAFDAEHARMTASQVGHRCGLTRTAARRHLLTLAHLGYVLTDGKLYWLTPRVLCLGQAYLESSRLPNLVQPFLQHVTASTGEAAYFAVLDQQDVVYVSRSGVHRHINAAHAPGSRMRAQTTAAGVAMLSQLPADALEAWLAAREVQARTSSIVRDTHLLRSLVGRARQQGWFVSDQPSELGGHGLAVPVFSRGDQMQGAVSVSVPMRDETTEVVVGRLLPVLQETARSMRRVL